MSEHFHFVVWIDHELAKIVNFNDQEAVSSVVRSGREHQHLHHKANAGDSGHLGIDVDFLDRVAHALTSAGAILIGGPSSAKTEFAQHLHQKYPDLAKRVSGVEKLDHPTPGELVAFARHFFRADDRMHAQDHRRA